MIGAEIQINEKEAVTIGTYNFAYIFISCGRKTGNRMVAAGSNFKERYTWIDHPLQIGDKIKIRIVETEQTSQPLTTQQSDRKKMKARYEQLKAEMKGFIVKSTTWGNQTHKVGLPEGCTISFEFSRWWGAIWCPSGYTNESENWSWHGGDIHVGDEVEIEVIEITPEEVDAPSHVIREKECTVPSPDENEDDPKIWEQKLYDYLQYKKILVDEGLIERE